MEQYKAKLYHKSEEMKQRLQVEIKDRGEQVREKLQEVQGKGSEGMYLLDHCPPKHPLQLLQAMAFFESTPLLAWAMTVHTVIVIQRLILHSHNF